MRKAESTQPPSVNVTPQQQDRPTWADVEKAGEKWSSSIAASGVELQERLEELQQGQREIDELTGKINKNIQNLPGPKPKDGLTVFFWAFIVGSMLTCLAITAGYYLLRRGNVQMRGNYVS